ASARLDRVSRASTETCCANSASVVGLEPRNAPRVVCAPLQTGSAASRKPNPKRPHVHTFMRSPPIQPDQWLKRRRTPPGDISGRQINPLTDLLGRAAPPATAQRRPVHLAVHREAFVHYLVQRRQRGGLDLAVHGLLGL